MSESKHTPCGEHSATKQAKSSSWPPLSNRNLEHEKKLNDLECEKREAEIAKLKAESIHLSLKWFKRPAYLGALIPVLLSLLGLATVLTQGCFDDRVEQANEEVEQAQELVSSLEMKSDMLEARIAFLDTSQIESFNALVNLKSHMVTLEEQRRLTEAELDSARSESDSAKEELAALLETSDAIRTITEADGIVSIDRGPDGPIYRVELASLDSDEIIDLVPAYLTPIADNLFDDERLRFVPPPRNFDSSEGIALQESESETSEHKLSQAQSEAFRALQLLPRVNLQIKGGARDLLAELGNTLSVIGLDMSGSDATNLELEQVSKLVRLQMLNVSRTQISDDGLAHISNLRGLQELELVDMQLSDQGLSHLHHLKNLKYLNVRGTGVSSVGMRALKHALPSVNVRYDPSLVAGFDDSRWVRDVELNEEFEAVSVTLHVLAAEETLKHLSELPALTTLILDDVTIDDLGVKRLQNLQALKHLEFRNVDSDLIDRALPFFAEIPNLESLKISTNFNDIVLTADGFRQLGKMKNLKVLKLTDIGGEITEQLLTQLQDLPELESLEVDCRVTDADLGIISSFNNLRHLRLSSYSNGITDAGLQNLSGLVLLETLDLSDNDGITDSGLQHLSNLEQLKWIDLRRTRVTLSGLQQSKVLNGKSLRDILKSIATVGVNRDFDVISVVFEGFTDSDCQTLEQISTLQSLNIGGSHQLTGTGLAHIAQLRDLKDLTAFGSGLTDDDIVHCQSMKGLESLSLRDNKEVTDKSLKHLVALSNLKSLALGGTGVTVEGLSQLVDLGRLNRLDMRAHSSSLLLCSDEIAELRRSLPNTEIIAPSPRSVDYRRAAWILATSPIDSERNGTRSIKLATEAYDLAGGESPLILDTLAAAYAEAGNFLEAERWQTMALDKADSPEEKDAFRSRLELYQEGKPYRIPE